MSLFKSGLIVTAYTFLSRILGFLREILIANLLGIGILTDCFNVAFKLPNFFRRFFAEGAFSAAFIPIFAEKLNTDSLSEVKLFSSRVFTIMSAILVAFVILLEIFMPYVIKVLAPGFHTQSYEAFILSVAFARICMPYLLFISLAALYGGILNSQGKFSAYAFVPVILNIVMILSLIIGKDTLTPAHRLSWGVFVAGISQYVFMGYIVYKYNFLPKFVKPKFTLEIKKMFKNMGPAILSNAIAQLNLIVDTMVCSTIPGAISTLYYADRITHLPISLIGTAMATVLLPELAKRSKTGDNAKAVTIHYNALKFAALLIFPCAFILLASSQEVIYLIYERGAFTREDTIRTALVILIFGLSIPAYVLTKIYVSRFLALKDTSTPFKVTLVGLAINVVLDLILVNPFGAAGVAFASTVTAWVIISLYALIAEKKGVFKHDKKLFLLLFKTLLASLVFYLAICVLSNYFNIYIYHINKGVGLLSFGFIIGVAGMIYLIFAKVFGLIDENMIKRFIKREGK
jgi:putative peptidoglycan lipid II flippase